MDRAVMLGTVVAGWKACSLDVGAMDVSRTEVKHGPSRAAVGIRALVLLMLAVFFPTVLVRDWSDNAYLVFPLVGVVLFLLSLPFVVAALIPAAQARATVTRVGVILVWIGGGICCLLLAFSLIPAATQYQTRTVFIIYLIGLALLLPVMIGIGWRLDRP
jgi:hypothetical protein